MDYDTSITTSPLFARCRYLAVLRGIFVPVMWILAQFGQIKLESIKRIDSVYSNLESRQPPGIFVHAMMWILAQFGQIKLESIKRIDSVYSNLESRQPPNTNASDSQPCCDWPQFDGHVMRDVTADCFLSVRTHLAMTKLVPVPVGGVDVVYTVPCRHVAASINLQCCKKVTCGFV